MKERGLNANAKAMRIKSVVNFQLEGFHGRYIYLLLHRMPPYSLISVAGEHHRSVVESRIVHDPTLTIAPSVI